MAYAGRSFLVVSPIFPYPPHGGERVDILGRLRALSELGFAVDLVATVKREPAEQNFGPIRRLCREVTVCPRSGALVSALGLRPMQVVSRRALAWLPLQNQYDAAILEGDYVEPILRNPSLRASRVLLRVHNDEVRYFRGLAAASGHRWAKSYYWSESWKFAWHSKRLRAVVDGLLFISTEELAQYRVQGRRRAFLLPPPVDPLSLQAPQAVGHRALFAGSLFMPNNVAGLDWYLAEVHPRILDIPGYELLVAGNTARADQRWLGSLTSQYSRVRLVRDPPDMSPVYADAAVFVNPMRSEGGVKVKTIHALEAGLAVVSTSMGAEGTGMVSGTHLLIADSGAEFAEHLRSLFAAPERARALARAAQEKLRAEFDARRNLDRILGEVLNMPREKAGGQ